jgi:hypothetical protein
MQKNFSMRFKVFLKYVFRILESILPKGVFNAFYKNAFPIYKEIRRSAYLLNGFIKYRLGGQSDKWFRTQEVYRAMQWSLVGAGGLEATYNLCSQLISNNVKGDFVELGVAQGGCASLIGQVTFDRYKDKNTKNLWLFDSFEGLPDPTEDDYAPDKGTGTGEHVRPLPKGSCLGTIEQVQNLLLEDRKFPKERIKFVKGWFQDTIPVTKNKIGSIALLRIDGDWYESTKTCLEGLYDYVSDGGAVVIDDYHSCYGAEKALHEFLDSRKLQPVINLDGRGGCYFFKS